MPFIGLSPFLHYGKISMGKIARCVNALYRAFSISTYSRISINWNMAKLCQCPLSGFFHFYKKKDKMEIIKKGVSMPFIGLFPFLLKLMKHHYSRRIYSVNALYRAFSISTLVWECPNCGNRDVSMPFIGLFPFLLQLNKVKNLYEISVNALYRAFSISTLPSGNALK